MFVVPIAADGRKIVLSYGQMLHDVSNAALHADRVRHEALTDAWEDRWSFVSIGFMLRHDSLAVTSQFRMRMVTMTFNGSRFRVTERDASCLSKHMIFSKVPKGYTHLIPRSRSCS